MSINNLYVPDLYARRLETMDIAELCEFLEITTDDLLELFSDRVYDKGVDNDTCLTYDDSDPDEYVDVDDAVSGIEERDFDDLEFDDDDANT